MTAAVPTGMPSARSSLGWRGNLMRFYSDPVEYMSYLYTTFGEVVEWVVAEPRRIFVFGPEYNRQLLTDPDLFHAYIIATPAREGTALHRLACSGLLAMNGESHRRQRHLILPIFQKQHVATYRDDMAAIAQAHLDRWWLGEVRDIAQDMRRLTLAIASKTLFGLDPATAETDIGGMIRRWLGLASSMTSVLFPFDLPGTSFRKLRILSEQIQERMLVLIRDKRAMSEQQTDVLAILVQAHHEDGSQLSDDELVGQLGQLFAAGYETSANALTWTLFLLAQHPDILADLVDELDSVLHGDAPTVEQFNRLPLLDRVIKESMRLLPPAVYAARIATASCVIGDYQIEPGTKIFFSHYITHRMPDFYPEPQRFLPDRWTRIDPSPYEYLPFSAGPRMCVGASFAPMEIKIVLALLLQSYRLSIPPGTTINGQVRVTLSPIPGMPMLISRRDQQFPRARVQGNILTMVDLTV